MKKNYLLMLLSSVLLLTGCRTESFNQEDSQIQERSNSILKVSLQEVLSETSRYDKELSHDISTFTWDKRSENKDSEKKI